MSVTLSHRGRRREWALLTALMLAYAAIFVAYYPPLPGIEDEIGFVNQALVWSRGAISAEGAGLSDLADFVPVAGRHVAARHPGRSLAALPFLALGGVRATFVSGLLLHLAMTALAALLLSRLGRSPLWAALLLLHPTLAIYSRTIMADAAAGTGLLLAAVAVTSASPLAGLGAGLAVGLAASMRYHAALALPIVAAAFVLPRGRPRPWRDARLCLLAGGFAGGLIVIYNLVVYHAPIEPFTGSRGYFSTSFFVPHGSYYAAALMTLWPAMLLAPALDRSPLRWLVRGVCGLFLGFLTLYYFHDRAPNWLGTVVVGQRLLQVALPLWVVSYAGVLDDWLVGPVRRRLGDHLFVGLAGLACVALLGATGLIFDRHQRHLNELLEARDAVIARVPEDSLILYDGSFTKLVGIPAGLPSYRLRQLTYLDRPAEDPRRLFADLDREGSAWYLAVLHKVPGDPTTEFAREVIGRYALKRLPDRSPILSLYAHSRTITSMAANPP
jgi:hypothetical protein